MAWDDAKKARAIELYQSKEPTAENSIQCVEEVAEELEESVNGVRMILIKAEVYVKKDANAPSASGKKAAGEGTKRVSKEAAQQQLSDAILAAGKEVDADIISKLTGKAALYFAGLFSQ